MKLLALFLFFLSLLSAPVLAQKKPNDFLSKFTIKRIGLTAPDSQKIILKDIRSVIVMDFRMDTTSLGFMQHHVTDNKFVIRSKKHLEKDISQLINEFTVHGNSGDSLDLVLAINKLWLTDEIENDVNTDIDPRNRKEFISGIMVKYEFALKDGEHYYPLLRFDTVISRYKRYVSDYASGYIFESLYYALSKLSSLKLTNAQSRLRKLNYTDIINYYSERSNIGVLRDTVYQKGIYKTFAEFKRNAPSITDYEIKFGKTEDLIYEKGKNGAVTSARDIWGFCDGKTIYIRSAENFFPLCKRDNCFYTNGAKSVTRSRAVRMDRFLLSPVSAMADDRNKQTVYSITLRPYQLDIVSGELF